MLRVVGTTALALAVVGCASTGGSEVSGPESVARTVVESFENNDLASLQSVLAPDFTVATGPGEESFESDPERFVFVAHSVAVESRGSWTVNEVIDGDTTGAATAVIGVDGLREDMLSLSIVDHDGTWQLARIDPVPLEIPADAAVLTLLDHGDRVDLTPQEISTGGFYLEIANRSDRERTCQILDITDGLSDEELDGMIGNADERRRRLRAGLGPRPAGTEAVVSFGPDYFEPGELLVLCADGDPSGGYYFAGRRLLVR